MAARVAAPALLMTMTDVAELAEVQRPVVTNWRRRYPDFPSSVSRDKSQPLFDPQEMAGWLLQTNRIGRERAEQELALFMLAGLAVGYEGRDAMAAVTALLCLRFLADEMTPLSDGAADPLAAAKALARSIDPNDGVLLAEVHSIPVTAGWLVRLVDDLVEASWNCREAFGRVMAARHRFGAGDLTTSVVDPALARLIAELSGAAERARRGPVLIADPAAGPATCWRPSCTCSARTGRPLSPPPRRTGRWLACCGDVSWSAGSKSVTLTSGKRRFCPTSRTTQT